MFCHLLESWTILQARLVLGDDGVKDLASDMPKTTRGKLMQRHPNQTAGLLSDD
jgi:hypothetical protein